MISGTDFSIEDHRLVGAAYRGFPPSVASSSEIAEIQSQCENNDAMCISCDDGMVAFDVRPTGDDLEMFVWVAVAFKHGAFERQEQALVAIGRDIGVKTLAFQSRRRGWGRRLGPEWQRRGSDEFVRPIHYV